MLEEQNSNPVVEPETSPVYPRSKYTLFFLLLLLLVSAVACARFFFASKSETSNTDQLTLEANIYVKAYYFMEHTIPAKSKGGALDARASMTQFRNLALLRYQTAVQQEPSFYNLRRLILIENPEHRSWVIQQYLRIPKADHDKVIYQKKIGDEIGIWRDIYTSTGKLSASRVAGYKSQIRDMHLGWYEHLALADLYQRAGMTKESAIERSDAGASAGRSVIILSFLMFAMVLLFFTGIFIGISYLAKKQTRSWPGAPNDVILLPEGERSIAAGYLLEIFVVYMLIFVLTQVLIGSVLGLVLRSGTIPSSLSLVLSQAIEYLVWGGVSLWYLIYRLRTIGWTLKNIGLTTYNLWTEIKWGIGGYASALPLVLAMSILSQRVMKSFDTPPNPIEPMLVGSETLLARIILFLLVAVAAPFFEEIFFRGVLFNSMRARWGLVAGILISAAIFGSVHPLPFGFLPIFALGSVFSIVFYQRGSLIPNMIAHSLQNSMAFFLTILLVS